MKSFPLILLAAVAFSTPVLPSEPGENVTEARAILARPTPRGGLSLPGIDIDIAAYVPGWTGIPIKADWAKAGEGGAKAFDIRGRDDGTVRFRGSGEWTQRNDGSLAGHIELECVAEIEVQCLTLSVSHPLPPLWGCSDGERNTFEFSLDDNRVIQLTTAVPIGYHSQDSHQWGGKFSTRIGGHLGTGVNGGIRTFKPGEHLVWDVAISSPEGIAFSDYKPLTITENENWVSLDYKKDVIPGSALDFSYMGLQSAPAGKYGWLKTIDGHFEFDGLPGVEQRFYGVNLCFSANYPDHEMADRLVERFVRCGYNTIRVHHHDGVWAAAYARRKVEKLNSRKVPQQSDSDIQPFNHSTSGDFIDDEIDRLDYLLARCYKAGLYVTTDLYVSRPVAWREIGIDRDGNMDKQLFKTYIGIHEGAFSNWCENAKVFLEHVNPYTGRANKDEPGMPLIALVNEGKLHMAWAGAQKAKDPVVREAWKRYCAERGVPPEEFNPEPPPPGSTNYADPHHQFDEWVSRRIWERCSAFVRSLGCSALLTNDNNGSWHGEGQGLTPLYDYVDSHFYVDHPQFLDQQWKLPSRCTQQNPVKVETPAIFHRKWSSPTFSKPCTITEWNFSGPGRYRAMGGILTGAMAASQFWDGLWRFAYSHSNQNLLDGQGYPGYFDCVTDPLIAASDRASVCLYLRGDGFQEAGSTCGAPSSSDSGTVSSAIPLRLDKESGAMVLNTPRTSGGFAESGRLDCGALSFEITGSPAIPATIWASSLDSKPLAESSRILLTHLTDVQGNAARYSDETRRILLQWGKKPLIENGSANVTLRIANPSEYTIFELDTAGNRVGSLPALVGDGLLQFTVSTLGPNGGRIFYEISR